MEDRGCGPTQCRRPAFAYPCIDYSPATCALDLLVGLEVVSGFGVFLLVVRTNGASIGRRSVRLHGLGPFVAVWRLANGGFTGFGKRGGSAERADCNGHDYEFLEHLISPNFGACMIACADEATA